MLLMINLLHAQMLSNAAADQLASCSNFQRPENLLLF
jgi:hypothetical protein